MNREIAILAIKESLGQGPRYDHTLRVAETAVILAHRFGENPEKAELAALYHDYAKEMPNEKLKQIIIAGKEDLRLLDYHPELWHGPAAAILIQEKFNISDQDIIQAVRYHTTGRKQMSQLEKIIYLADYIEPGRNFPGLEEVRKLAEKDLDQAILQALRNTIQFLTSKFSSIYPDTIEAYNDFIRKGVRPLE